jgi:hypothetical protein
MKLKKSKLSLKKKKRMSKMISYKQIINFLLIVLSINLVFSAGTINQEGDFSVHVESLKSTIYNDNLENQFNFEVENNENFIQEFNINNQEIRGWIIDVNPRTFQLEPNEKKEIQINFKSNSEFDYTTNVVSPDEIIISQDKNYIGSFEFPFFIIGNKENVSIRYRLNIEKKPKEEIKFKIQVSDEKLSPINPIKYTISQENLEKYENITISLRLEEKEIIYLKDSFGPSESFKIYQNEISKDINPGFYDFRFIIRLANEDGKSAMEWYETKNLEVEKYENITTKTTSKENILSKKYQIVLKNHGNVKTEYKSEVETSYLNSFFFVSKENYNYENGKKILLINLEKGEEKTIKYSFNYLFVYLVLLFIIILGSYITYRKKSNPLDVETTIYEIKKVKHEGVKSLKVKIGFENIKADEIEHLRIIFRMPSYLNVKDESFLLTEPNSVLKGKTQYKLMWDFKRFEKEDSRIIGFTLVNSKGILGNINIPDLELELKINGKLRRYYTPFPIIKG